MRIAYVCADPGIPVFGTKGASVHVQEVVRVLLAAGHTVDLFCRRTGGAPPAAAGRRLRVHELARPTARADGAGVRDDGGTDVAAREAALLAADDHLHDALTAAGGRAGFDAVYERYSLWSRAGTRYAATRRIPAVLEVNAPLPAEQARHRGLVHAAEADAVVRDAARAATAVVCVSEPVAAWVRGHLGPRHTTRVVVEPNGVDVDRIRPAPAAAAAAAAGRPFTVGFVGTLKPWHGTATLLDAVALLRRTVPDARLLLVGDGPEAADLRRRAGAAGIADAVTFTGAVRPAEVPGWLHRMDVAAAPYPAGDGAGYFSPLKVYEYLAAGLPVVASAVGQLPAVLDDGTTGLLVPGSDPGALAAALRRLADDPVLGRRLGRAGRASVVATRTWTQVVDRSLAAAGLRLGSADGAVAGGAPECAVADATAPDGAASSAYQTAGEVG
ncbi:glycosyltransferase family 4 protein [Georgenia sp. TF02-10]|uniref:glycosyltransferase family 4 protein n=1 Tax=Georgenia sp. TF02-10 TaxID=2917725 RepID=UPI001FA7F897|nr:glycosyltransferase family 4 protein [Georgenia sp. TF02-10]UNX53665.1 glycosyltransferase family 4 protein [Georgenia sp. TF02-10]